MTTTKQPLGQLLAVGLMLFALFFGAGNLIFPAQLGQESGHNIFLALSGFLLTGAGLPLLGVAAIGYSKTGSVRELASRAHPIFGLLFAMALYLTIGPFFALPRTATVAFETGVVPLANVTDSSRPITLLIFTIVFFSVSLWLSLSPGQLVNRIGKVLTPMLLVSILLLVIYGMMNPMGELQNAEGAYQKIPMITGFIAGYNTMDALASLVFGIIVIQAIDANNKNSADHQRVSMRGTIFAGLIAAIALALVYGFIAHLGASSVQELGHLNNGAAILAGIAKHYFGTYGSLLMAAIVILACLTTSVGLICACSNFFQTLMPRIPYRNFVIVFSVFSCIVANRGLNEIITYSIPVLMLLYPLTIVLIFLTFLVPLFKGARITYFTAILFTLPISLLDGYKAIFGMNDALSQFLGKTLPLYDIGLGWIAPALVGFVIGIGLSKAFPDNREQLAVN